ncbi:MAG: Gfo/Idh/MocA family oxidoreductase [Proteobacteria bacterium]|jgi:phthalate 4,5-cis-dihydrodiol dehydrogenase|nr:Gfo/Idh/MocA family oxidoreductase [Pseudomonadota bacterium]
MTEPPLRIGVIGLGRAFSLMVPTFAHDPRVRIVAGFDPRDEPRRRLASDFGAATYGQAEALCRDPAVEAVYVASPHQFHAEHVQMAARNGKHVLAEKPMALRLAECDAMIRTCDEARVKLVVGHCHSFDTPYLHTRELIRSGNYGAVRMIHAFNYTDFLYRPRRPEELRTQDGGGVVFSQAAHQIDVVRLLAGGNLVRVRATTAAWDAARPTEGAYSAMLWFDNGCFATVVYSGYAHYDSDEWCGWIGEMGQPKDPARHGSARARLGSIGSPQQEAELKAATTYGGSGYRDGRSEPLPVGHQHFGAVVASCERADLRPMPDGVWIDSNGGGEKVGIAPPAVPRSEVIDELVAAVRHEQAPLHDGSWARDTLAGCLAILESARDHADVHVQPYARIHA